MASKSGDRKLQILQGLAQMLEQPQAGRITTAALAKQQDVSEAALYRHFSGKAAMFDGLLDFIEGTLFTLINQIATKGQDGIEQARQIAQVLLGFSERNRGMTRVMTGEALVTEDARLQQRLAHFGDRVEAAFKQALREAVMSTTLPEDFNVSAQARVLTHFVFGCWMRYSQSGWQHAPTEGMQAQLALLLDPLVPPFVPPQTP